MKAVWKVEWLVETMADKTVDWMADKTAAE